MEDATKDHDASDTIAFLSEKLAQETRAVIEPDEASVEALAARAEDHALIRRAQQGEEHAFAALVHRHQARAWRIARNLVASEEDAQDLAQEAFLRVFRNLGQFDFEHGFTTWLYRIVTNLAIDHLRKRRPAISTTRADEEQGDIDLPDANVDRPSDGLEREELAREVHACLSNLAPHFQSVLMLREIEGLPCNEIAHIVGATHVTVRWRLHRGRKLFQEEWSRRARLAEAGADVLDVEAVPDEADDLNDLNDPNDNGGQGIPRGNTSRERRANSRATGAVDGLDQDETAR